MNCPICEFEGYKEPLCMVKNADERVMVFKCKVCLTVVIVGKEAKDQ